MVHDKIRIAIVDDHSLFADGMVSILQQEEDMEVGVVQNNAGDLLDSLTDQELDIILLDINMPGINGIDAIKKVLVKGVDIKVVMLSTYNDCHLIKQAKAQGASGYILKNAHRHELVAAIRSVHEGNLCFPRQKKKRDWLLEDTDKAEEPVIRYLSLTDREKEVLEYMLNNTTSEDIATALHISFHTVKTHRKNIMRKLRLKTPAELIKFVMKNKLQ